MAEHVPATFRHAPPSLPVFLPMPVLLLGGRPFWWTLVTGCGLLVVL